MSKITPTKAKVTLITYEIKATIPTGPYANISPCITVSAPSLDEARDYVLPHIDALYERYLNLSDRPKPRVLVKETPAPVTTEMSKSVVEVKEVPKEVLTVPMNINQLAESTPVPEVISQTETNPGFVQSEAYQKAQAAVDSCKSVEALNLIADRINISVKLDALDKTDLSVLVATKRTELQG